MRLSQLVPGHAAIAWQWWEDPRLRGGSDRGPEWGGGGLIFCWRVSCFAAPVQHQDLRIAVSSIRPVDFPVRLPHRDHSFACRQVIFHDRPSRDKVISQINEANRYNSYVLFSARLACTCSACSCNSSCRSPPPLVPQNEQTFRCICTKASDAAPAKVSLGKGSAEHFVRANTQVSVACASPERLTTSHRYAF